MTKIFLVAGLLGLSALGAMAADAPAGYRDCSPHDLGACQNSNQLFWGVSGKSGRAPAKRETAKALAAFLHKAPPLYLGKSSFSAAQTAAASLVGPGGHHDPLPGGGWFFDGFTPHDAGERSAVIFDADGKIRAVALLNVESDMAGPDPSSQDLNRHHLRIYSHDEPAAANTGLLQAWARAQLKTIPEARLAATELFTAIKNTWKRRDLP